MDLLSGRETDIIDFIYTVSEGHIKYSQYSVPILIFEIEYCTNNVY